MDDLVSIHADTKYIKDIISRYVPRQYVSVQRRGMRPKIAIKEAGHQYVLDNADALRNHRFIVDIREGSCGLRVKSSRA